MHTNDPSIARHHINTHTTLDVHDRASVLNRADTTVRIGTAPDGLPLLLTIQRSASIVEPVLRALHATEVSSLSKEVRGHLTDLNHRVQRERRDLGVAKRGPFVDVPHYVTMSSVPELVGTTLLARLLGPTSPLLLPEDTPAWRAHDEVVAKTSVGVLMNAAEFQQLKRELDTRQHLCIPLDDSPTTIVRQAPESSLDLTAGRVFVHEDLRRLPSTRFHGYRRGEAKLEGEKFSGLLSDHDAYGRAVRRADTIGWSVTRHDLLRVVVEVARSLVPLHTSGIVHGDIKPANIFITADGATAHDSLDIQAGSLSAAGTKGWNAPEQIIARPCTPATDVFALAQLVVQILQAAVFGDERSFVVPIGNGQRIRERMIAAPDVFIDPTMISLDDAAIGAWRAFLRRCLLLDADQRQKDAATFADELASLIEDHPVPGHRAVSRLSGQLVRQPRGGGLIERTRRAIAGTPDVDVAWILEDSYADVHQTPWRFLIAIAA